MYSLMRHAPKSDLLLAHAPALVAAFAIASFFYKFGSFALECVAFLATWFVIDFLLTSLRAIWPGRPDLAPTDRP
jgi:hypothetical protein